MAIAFMLAWGYSQPRILSSFDFTDYDQSPPHDSNYNTLSPSPVIDNVCSNGWNCQHRWRQIYNMVAFHNVVSGKHIKKVQYPLEILMHYLYNKYYITPSGAMVS